MKKLVNDPVLVVEDMVEGLLLADRRLTRIEGGKRRAAQRCARARR